MSSFWNQFFRFSLDKTLKGESSTIQINGNENLHIVSSKFIDVSSPIKVIDKSIRLLSEDSLFKGCSTKESGAAIDIDCASASFCESIIYRCCGYQCYVNHPDSQRNGNFISIKVNTKNASQNMAYESSSSHCYNPDGTKDSLVYNSEFLENGKIEIKSFNNSYSRLAKHGICMRATSIANHKFSIFSNGDVTESVIYSRGTKIASYTSSIFTNITAVNSHIFTSDYSLLFSCYISDIYVSGENGKLCEVKYNQIYIFNDCVIPDKFKSEAGLVIANTNFAKPELAFLRKWNCEAEISFAMNACSIQGQAKFLSLSILEFTSMISIISE